MKNKSSNKKNSFSITDASALKKVFSGVREPIGIRIDTGLYKRVKSILIYRHGSICRPMESWMVAHLAISQDLASKNYTTVIEKLNIERNIRSRRKLPNDNDIVVEDKGSFEKCFVCSEPRKFLGFDKSDLGTHLRVFLCKNHFEQSRFKSWRELS